MTSPLAAAIAVAVALAACGTPAAPPAQPLANVKPEPAPLAQPPVDAAPPSSGDPVVAAIFAFRDHACACVSVPDPSRCAQGVTDDMSKWAQLHANGPAARSAKPDARETEAIKQLTECLTKALMAGVPAQQPVPPTP